MAPPLAINILREVGDEELSFHTFNTKYIQKFLTQRTPGQEFPDAVYISPQSTVFFQVDVSAKNQVKLQGISKLLKGIPLNSQTSVSVVFVLPKGNYGTDEEYNIQVDSASMANHYPQYVYFLDLKELD